MSQHNIEINHCGKRIKDYLLDTVSFQPKYVSLKTRINYIMSTRVIIFTTKSKFLLWIILAFVIKQN